MSNCDETIFQMHIDMLTLQPYSNDFMSSLACLYKEEDSSWFTNKCVSLGMTAFLI